MFTLFLSYGTRLAKSQKYSERVKFSLEGKSTLDHYGCMNVYIQNIKIVGRIIVANITTSLFQEMVQAGLRA